MYCRGKHPAVNHYKTFRFGDFLKPALPTPAPAFSNLDRVYASVGISDPTSLFPMDYNDKWGCCTIAGAAHAETVFGGLVGKKHIPAADTVRDTYFDLTGGEDSGLNELQVLKSLRKDGFDGEKILGFAKVQPHNHTHVQLAVQMFGGVYLGFQVQENADQDFEARRPWTPGTLTGDGHAVFATDYKPEGGTVLTWGNTQEFTWAWWDECVDEAYVILPSEAETAGFAPGFDFDKLRETLARL